MVTGEGMMKCGVCGTDVPSNLVIQLGGKTVCMNCKGAVSREMAGARPVGQLRYAGFWIRLVALIIDGFIMMVPIMVVVFAVGMGAASMDFETRESRMDGLQGLMYLLFYGAQLLYSTFFIGKFGATPGKMAVKIKVVRSDGSPVGFGRAFGRYLGTILSGLICNIGYIMAAFDAEKRSLHDRLADTRVVYK